MKQIKKNKKWIKWSLWIGGLSSVFLLASFFISACLILIMAGGNKMMEEQKASEECNTSSEVTTTVNIQTSADMEKNAKSIWDFLISKGATPEGAAGIMGVWEYESRFDPKAVNASSGATGVAQWLGVRLTQLQSYASSKGKKVTDLGTQMEFFWKEMHDPYYKNQGVLDVLKEKDVHKACKDFLLIFEGMSQNPEQWFLTSNGAGGPGRYQMADRWYAKFKGDKITSSIVESASGGDSVQADIVCEPGQGTAWRDKIIEVAKTQSKTQYFLGNPQVWGSKLDCSGLVQGTYERAVNIKVGRNTIAQEKDFREIPKSEAQKGDICFWGPKGATDHVAIYDGDGGVYEMKDENLDFKHSPLKGYSKGQPTYFATLEGTELGKQLPKDDEGGSVGGSWCWPSPSNGSFSSEQDFGPRTLAVSPWHNGLDFGSASWPNPKILACHGGKVIFAGDPGTKGIDNSYPNGLGKAVIVVRDGGYNFVYQEFSTTTSSIRVKVGDTVKAGQWIASRNTAHMHLGITKSDWVAAQAKYLTDDGTWLDPQKMIRNGMKKG